jgi:hypothetical protein
MRRPPRATLMSIRWLNFPCAHCVDTFAQVTFDAFEPSRFARRPAAEHELRDKFIDCAKIDLGQQGADAAFRHMNGIERLANLRDLPLVARV